MTSFSITSVPRDEKWTEILRSRPVPRQLIIKISGVLDKDTCRHLQAHLTQNIKTPIIIFDLEQLSELDSNGLGVVLVAVQSLTLMGKKVRLKNAQGQPKQLLEYLGMQDFFGE